MTQKSSECRTITIGTIEIPLKLSAIYKKICEWHLDKFEKKYLLGAPKEAIKIISQKLGVASKGVEPEKMIGAVNESVLKTVPPLKIFTTNYNVAITDFVINNETKQKKFGIGWSISKEMEINSIKIANKIGPIQIDGVALLVEVTPKDNADEQNNV